MSAWIGLPQPMGDYLTRSRPQVADPTSPSSTRGMAGKNNLNEEIIPLLSTGKASDSAKSYQI
jgi:hypothetical protein